MIVESEYQEALDYLYKYVDYSLVRNLRYSPEKFDLKRMFDFVNTLGNPERNYPILHVAGTKGKGSVSAMCASALEAAGYRVGLYTSPHLTDFAERLRVNGCPIPHQELVALVDDTKTKIESIPELTTFEITTALAFLYFHLQGVEAAVIEVGLGGRLDPTNVAIPIVSVITSISYDHTLILGDTLAQIASEKAGIIKPGVPVVVAPQKDEARKVIEQAAEQQSAPLIQVGRDYLFAPLSHSLENQTLLVWAAS
jgi:dihydrofolate synthase/folylpolyglutamate synthase